MRPIEMCDLRTQYARIRQEIDQSIDEVLVSGQFIRGPVVQAFEQELASHTGSAQVIGCANGTDALQIALMALELQPGDEVITPSFTYAATVEVVKLLGLIPVYVDVDEKTFLLDVHQLEPLITSRTRAIIPVHLFGQCADMEPIMAIAQRHQLAVIEDTAQAIDAQYTFSDGTVKKAGTMGDIGTVSFFPSKNLGCYGDGGALFTQNQSLADKLRMIANHGQSGLYQFDRVGVNSRLDALQAAILRVKLKQLKEYTQRRQRLASRYDDAFRHLPQLITPFCSAHSTHVFHQYTLRVPPAIRNNLREKLANCGIPTMIYYPSPMHLQPAYQVKNTSPFLPVSELLPNCVLSLPMHTEMDELQFNFITQHLVTEYLKLYNE